jgi:hypothetical protein
MMGWQVEKTCREEQALINAPGGAYVTGKAKVSSCLPLLYYGISERVIVCKDVE